MKDDAVSEEDLLRELDSMYQRVADLETNEPISHKKDHSFKAETFKGGKKPVQGKVIPFPEKKISASPPSPSNQDAETSSGKNPLRKSPYFKYIAAIFLSVFFWACIFWVGSFFKAYSSLGNSATRSNSSSVTTYEPIQKTIVPAIPPAAEKPQK